MFNSRILALSALVISLLSGRAFAGEVSIIAGQKLPLSSLNVTNFVTVEVSIDSSLNPDFTAIPLDKANKVFDDSLLVFFNQPVSRGEAIKMSNSGSKHTFTVELSKLPSTVNKIVFSASVDGVDPISKIKSGSLSFINGANRATYSFLGSSFKNEKAIMIAEIYRHGDQWKLSAVGQGFNGGLQALLENFGVVIKADPTTKKVEPISPIKVSPPAPARAQAPASAPVKPVVKEEPSRIVLEKQTARLELDKLGSKFIDLNKKAKVALEKFKIAEDQPVHFEIVLDSSGSMNENYRSGLVQDLLSKVATMGFNLGGQKEIPAMAYATETVVLENITLKNLPNYVEQIQKTKPKIKYLYEDVGRFFNSNYQFTKKTGVFDGGSGIIPGAGYENEEPIVMKAIMEQAEQWCKDNPGIPIYLMFITDGGINSSNSNQIEKLLIEASAKYPIFWKYIGIGEADFGILQRLDDIPISQRPLDNADFVDLNDIRSIDDTNLYDRMLNEFDTYPKRATQTGVLKPRTSSAGSCAF
jgi:stress response protein SCP2